jgi:hypothetical protein
MADRQAAPEFQENLKRLKAERLAPEAEVNKVTWARSGA